MSISAAVVLFAVIWFMLFLVILPLRLVTQGEAGSIVPGTHASAPENPQVGRKARLTTVIAVILWAAIAGVILSGAVSVHDIDWFNRMSTPAAQ